MVVRPGDAPTLGCFFLALVELIAVSAWADGRMHAALTLTILVAAVRMMFMCPDTAMGWFAERSRRAAFLPALVLLAIAIGCIGTVHRVRVVQDIALAILAMFFFAEGTALGIRIRLRQGRLLAQLGVCIAIPCLLIVSGLTVPKMVDIATTTADAGRSILAGGNPYHELIDHFAFASPGGEHFGGYKYTPLMAILYIPFVSALGQSGILVGNILLFAGTGAAAFFLARRISAGDPKLAVVLVLATPIFANQALSTGATDIAAVLPILLAFFFWNRYPTVSGLLIGASLSMKLAPAMFALTLCAPARIGSWARYALGVAVGLIPTAVYFLWSPEDFYRNIILFNAVRSTDSSSWLYYAPAWVGPVVRGAFLLAWGLVIYFSCVVIRTSLYQRLAAFVVVSLCAVLTAPIYHDNYPTWWAPMVAILIAASGGAVERLSHHPPAWLPRVRRDLATAKRFQA
jgi:hypothetical protein